MAGRHRPAHPQDRLCKLKGTEHIMARCVVLHPNDSVAVALEPVGRGDSVKLSDGREIVALDAIPFAHKMAIAPMVQGGDVRKYGEVIGEAVIDIQIGQHVHIHNIRSRRT